MILHDMAWRGVAFGMAMGEMGLAEHGICHRYGMK